MKTNHNHYKRGILFLIALYIPVFAHADGVIPMWFVFLSGVFVLGLCGVVIIITFYIIKRFIEIRREEIEKEKRLKKRD
ncbi:hypothetical protein [Acinetobacter wuhouensis]|uniref:Uncharacterized protein n=1 Tax=Acinetobacter wuhouensis TaxID=1879050 RepID=A0A4Q7AJW8_9GAMM|nr:hypothetical protein [Acinetobacter wuhouensis]RZG49071.1 hypothetical protein EXU28_01695 [Acinetobacter wuhouensis]